MLERDEINDALASSCSGRGDAPEGNASDRRGPRSTEGDADSARHRERPSRSPVRRRRRRRQRAPGRRERHDDGVVPRWQSLPLRRTRWFASSRSSSTPTTRNWGSVVNKARVGDPDRPRRGWWHRRHREPSGLQGGAGPRRPQGVKGSALYSDLGKPPFGWPKDAVTAALYAAAECWLHHRTSQDGNDVNGVQQLPQTQVGKTTFYKDDDARRRRSSAWRSSSCSRWPRSSTTPAKRASRSRRCCIA